MEFFGFCYPQRQHAILDSSIQSLPPVCHALQAHTAHYPAAAFPTVRNALPTPAQSKVHASLGDWGFKDSSFLQALPHALGPTVRHAPRAIIALAVHPSRYAPFAYFVTHLLALYVKALLCA